LNEAIIAPEDRSYIIHDPIFFNEYEFLDDAPDTGPRFLFGLRHHYHHPNNHDELFLFCTIESLFYNFYYS
jgi:hypothetical protein